MDLSLLVWGDAGWGDELFFGALMTLAVATASYFLGIFFGIGFAAMKLSKHTSLHIIADIYTTVIRGQQF